MLESSTRMQERVDERTWIYSMDLGNGVRTKGVQKYDDKIHRAALDSVDFRGKTVLDVGALEGMWTFEAERRGAAQVYSIDLPSQNFNFDPSENFRLAAEVRGSKAKYRHLSVYDVPDAGFPKFDVVIFMGVYYHLTNPLLAFARLRQVMNEGAILIVEGQVCDGPQPTAVFHYRQPLLGDLTNWWVPTPSCLREWVECSYFEVLTEHPAPWGDYKTVRNAAVVRGWERQARYALTARAVTRHDPLRGAPDSELDDFELNPRPQ